jgi:hypothetical protein
MSDPANECHSYNAYIMNISGDGDEGMIVSVIFLFVLFFLNHQFLPAIIAYIPTLLPLCNLQPTLSSSEKPTAEPIRRPTNKVSLVEIRKAY